MINKITPSVVLNYWSKCFDTTNLEREAVKNQISSLKKRFWQLTNSFTSLYIKILNNDKQNYPFCSFIRKKFCKLLVWKLKLLKIKISRQKKNGFVNLPTALTPLTAAEPTASPVLTTPEPTAATPRLTGIFLKGKNNPVILRDKTINFIV